MRFGTIVCVAAGTIAPSATAFSQTPSAAPRAKRPPAGYHVINTFTLGGDGSWDYLTLDTAGNRVFIARQNRIMVVDLGSGKLLGEVPGINGAHGVALAYPEGHGFATGGRDSSVTMFDLKTLKVLGKTKAAEDADGVLYDPVSKRIFTMNGDDGSSSVFDPATGKNIGTVPLGGKPEFAVSAGDGKVFANLEDSAQVVEIDAVGLKVTRRWPLAPCKSPTGLAIDVEHHRLFSGCRGGKVMAMSDAVAGRLITTVPIGEGVDAAAFDPATALAFASTADGNITVVHEDSPDRFTVVQNATTMAGARTMTLDVRSHRLYTVSAKFGPPPKDSTAANPRRRPPILPGTFRLLVLGN
jgi:YVTN family beta-propeller protein